MIRICRTSFIFLTCIPYVMKCQSCPASMLTLRIVEKCPTTKEEWNAASLRKKCNFLADYKGCEKTLVYHCLLNQWGNETLEVCAPPWYISGFCAMFNTVEQRVIDNFNIDCTKFNNGTCPSRYLSSDAYKYKYCYKKRKLSSLTSSSSNENTMDQNGNKQFKDTNNQLPLIIPLVLSSIGVLVLSIVLALTCTGKIGKGAGHRSASTTNGVNQTYEANTSNRDPENYNIEDGGNDEDGTNEKDTLISSKADDSHNDGIGLRAHYVSETTEHNVVTTSETQQRKYNFHHGFEGGQVHNASVTTTDKVDTTQTKTVAELRKYHTQAVENSKFAVHKESLTEQSSQSAFTRNNGKRNNTGMGEDTLDVNTINEDGEDSLSSNQSESSSKENEVTTEKIVQQKETPHVSSEDLYPTNNNSESVDLISATVQGNQDPSNLMTDIPKEDDNQQTPTE